MIYKATSTRPPLFALSSGRVPPHELWPFYTCWLSRVLKPFHDSQCAGDLSQLPEQGGEIDGSFAVPRRGSQDDLSVVLRKCWGWKKIITLFRESFEKWFLWLCLFCRTCVCHTSRQVLRGNAGLDSRLLYTGIFLFFLSFLSIPC